MTRPTALLLVAVLAGAPAAAPVPKEDEAARLFRIYGRPHGFDEANRYVLAGDRLRVFVAAEPDAERPGLEDPPAPRPLAAPVNPDGGPRIWRPVKGDFTVAARVSLSRLDPNDLGAPLKERPGLRSARAAGLVAWQGWNNFLALARLDDGRTVRLCFTHPDGVRTAEADLGAEPEWLHLRLRRAGATVTAGYSTDGKKWTELLPDEVEWGDTVSAGAFAQNSIARPFEATFEEYKLTVPPK